ncbi:MAG: beta-galactosidase [Oscillospiraceae bacterium]|jgi:beta-galactosidase|nr:beta-galactosidase [Oscillospiraceae bacterium]
MKEASGASPRYGTVFKVQREFTMDEIAWNLRNIADAGLNTVVIWPSVYWWEDRTKPGYPYNTGREILRIAQTLGLTVIMETAGQITALEYAPDFVMKPEYFPIQMDGLRQTRGWDYGYLNYFHPEVDSLMRSQFAQIAAAYKDFPALYGYDIFNETMYASYDPYTLFRFRDWLRRKYTTIEALNHAWDRVYYDFSQVQFDHWTWASVMPYVDMLEFQRDAIGMLLRGWRDVFRAVDPHHPTIADNLYSTFNHDPSDFRPTDEWVTDQNVDELGMSYYPKNGVPAFAPHKRWEMLRGFASASKNGRFWVSELQSHNQSAYRPNTLVSAEELRMWTLECYAAGTTGVIYWKWRPFTRGIQTSGRGIVDYKSRSTLRLEAVRVIADTFARAPEALALAKPEPAKAAILYDRLNVSFQKAYTHAYGNLPQAVVLDSLEGLFRCLFDCNVPADFVVPAQVGAALARTHPALFISAQIMISEALAASLAAYAEAGGHLVIDGKFGFINEIGLLHGEIPGGQSLRRLLGLDWVDVDCLGQSFHLDWNGQTFALEGSYERQLMVTDAGARVVGRFEDGYPACVRVPVGQGEILYFPTALWYGYHQRADDATRVFMRQLADDWALRTYQLTGACKVMVQRMGASVVVYAFNHTDEQQRSDLRVPVSGALYRARDLSSGEAVPCVIADSWAELAFELPPQGATIFLLDNKEE